MRNLWGERELYLAGRKDWVLQRERWWGSVFEGRRQNDPDTVASAPDGDGFTSKAYPPGDFSFDGLEPATSQITPVPIAAIPAPSATSDAR